MKNMEDIFGNDKLTMIAGPCVIESLENVMEIAKTAKSVADKLGINYVFKASFDKANRTSAQNYRGPGLEKGLEILAEVKSEGILTITDIHEPWQAEPAAAVVDFLQIPAFLCRQTDLLKAAAETGKPINVKKAQFMSPEEMSRVVSKLLYYGNDQIILCERGTAFGYHNQVVDMTSIPRMQRLGCPVVIDATHSVQISGGGAGNGNSGSREYVPYIAKAAIAAGADGIFMEIHPTPDKALCDASCMLKLSELEELMEKLVKIYHIVKQDSSMNAAALTAAVH